MSPEERKRLEAIIPRKCQSDNGGNNSAYNGGYNGGNNGGNIGGQQGKVVTPTKNDILKLFGFAPDNPTARAICYNCQKPGHYAKNFTEPKKIKNDG